MTTQQEWTAIGRFVAMVVKIFTTISTIFKEVGVGIEVAEWLVGEGMGFLTQKIREIAEECKRQAKTFFLMVTGIDRSLSPQQVIDATARKQYTDKGVIETMPHGDGSEKRLVFFQVEMPTGYMSNEEVAEEFKKRKLKLDPYALARANQIDQTLADTKPNATLWKVGDNWYYIAFGRWRDERGVDVGRGDFDWDGSWWFVGVPE